jgi:hypothetical protein
LGYYHIPDPKALRPGRRAFAVCAGSGPIILPQSGKLSIDGRRFSCYNALTESIKEASSMGETPRKPNISVGLMAHVDAGR